MVNSLTVLSHLGHSDHNMLEWDVPLSPVSSLFNRPCLDYAHADFAEIRKALHDTDWSCLLQGSVNDKWHAFHTLLKSLESQFVPFKKRSLRRKKPHGSPIKL